LPEFRFGWTGPDSKWTQIRAHYVPLERQMIITLTIAGAVAGMGYGIAAVIRAYFFGKAALVRAQRGEPEPPNDRAALPRLLRKP
jgi:hypothetical protein